MFGRRTLDLLLKLVLVQRIESTRVLSTKNVNSVTSWRQLKPRAPRKRKQSKEQKESVTKTETSTIHSVAVPKRSLPSIQALESTSGPAQRKGRDEGRDEVLKSASNKATEMPSHQVSVNGKLKELTNSKFSSSKKVTNPVGILQREQAKEPLADNIKNVTNVVGSENEKIDFTKWKFCSASFLGCTPGEVTQRMKELGQAGFCNDHIDLLLRKLPPILRINSKMVYQNVNSFVKWNVPWKQVIDTNPEILLLEPSQVML